MEKILVINGSPKGKLSTTMKLTNAFLKGLKKKNVYKIEEISSYQLNIKDCLGCFHCMKDEKGRCAQKDDMKGVFQKYLEADLVIWSFPLYFFGMPSSVKRIMDRLLPLYDEKVNSMDGKTTQHEERYDLHKQRIIVFSSGAYFNYEKNFDALDQQFEFIYGNRCDKIFCPGGQLLETQFLDYRTQNYLKALEIEGEHFHQTRKIRQETKDKFKEPFLDLDEFLKFGEVFVTKKKINESKEDYEKSKISTFFTGLSLTYDAKQLMVDQAVMEIELVDYPYCCQLHMNQEKCLLIENKEAFLPYCLKVRSKYAFFSSNPSLTSKNKARSKGADFNTFIQLINKYQQKGIQKEMNFN